MKKLIIALIFFSFVAVPLQAKTTAEILVKGGIIASPYLNLDGAIADVDVGFILGAEAYLFPWENIGLGLGATHLFDTDIENTAKKISYNNAYVTVKPKIVFEGKEITALYFIGQLGVSKAEIKIIDDCGAGIYVAGGVGIEANWFILEAIYSYTNWAIKDDSAKRAALYTLGINMGYKFKI